MRLVRVVIRTLSSIETLSLHSPITSSICDDAGLISTSGSVKPVGLTSSSTKLSCFSLSYLLGVAET